MRPLSGCARTRGCSTASGTAARAVIAQCHQFPLAMRRLYTSMARRSSMRSRVACRQVRVGAMHVDELRRVATVVWQIAPHAARWPSGVRRRSSGRWCGSPRRGCSVCRPRESPGSGDVMDLRTVRQREAGVVLGNIVAEQLHRCEQLLVGTICWSRNTRTECSTKAALSRDHAGRRQSGCSQIDASDLGAGMW